MKYFVKQAEDAKGIPDRKAISPIPTDVVGRWPMSVQKHYANRAGKHYDLRLGDEKSKKAYSWAIRYWPKPGEKRLAIRQPDHTIPYMSWQGTIKKGYGAGKVKLVQRDYVDIDTAPKKINFHDQGTDYTLINTDGNNWLILNRGQN